MAGSRPLVWLSLLTIASFALLALSPLRAAGSLEERAAALVAAPAGALRDLASPVADVLLNAGQVRRLSDENAALRQQVAQLEANLAALREQQGAAQQAQALLQAVGAEAGEYVTASVVLRDPAPGRQAVLIDRGAVDGVVAGQPVLGPGATLVGVVSEVGEHRSRVRLVTDEASAVAALVQSSRIQAALAGSGEELRLEFVPEGAPIAPGDVILTSALGGQLPPGLLVGRVESAQSSPQELFQRIVVQPLADLDRVEQVLVMTAFRPGTSAEALEVEPGAGE